MSLRRTHIAMLEGASAGHVLGRTTAGTGPVEELTGAQVRGLALSTPEDAAIVASVEAMSRSLNGLPPEAMLAAPWQVERGSTLLTVTSSAKRVVSSTGLLATVAVNTPAYSWATGRRQLLIEPAATNLMLQSEALNTTWTKVRMTVTADATTAPDGATTADKFVVDTSVTTSHYIRQSALPVTTGVAMTLSAFLKAGELSFVRLQLGAGSSTYFVNAYATVDLSTGTIANSGDGVTRTSVTQLANGWYRVSITAVPIATGTSTVDILAMSSATNNLFTGNGVDGFWLWGAQLELGDVASSYIPTTTAAVTRSADDAQLTTAARTMLIGLGATLVLRGVAPSALSPPVLLGGDAVAMAEITSGGALRLSDGTTTLDVTAGSGAVGTGFGAALSRGPGPLRRAALNGGAVATDAHDWWSTTPTTLRIGGASAGPTGPVRIDEISIWPWVAGAAATPLLARAWS